MTSLYFRPALGFFPSHFIHTRIYLLLPLARIVVVGALCARLESKAPSTNLAICGVLRCDLSFFRATTRLNCLRRVAGCGLVFLIRRRTNRRLDNACGRGGAITSGRRTLATTAGRGHVAILEERRRWWRRWAPGNRLHVSYGCEYVMFTLTSSCLLDLYFLFLLPVGEKHLMRRFFVLAAGGAGLSLNLCFRRVISHCFQQMIRVFVDVGSHADHQSSLPFVRPEGAFSSNLLTSGFKAPHLPHSTYVTAAASTLFLHRLGRQESGISISDTARRTATSA